MRTRYGASQDEISALKEGGRAVGGSAGPVKVDDARA